MSDEIPKHKKFLEHFVETRDVKEAARLSGIENPATISAYYHKYKNIYKALFEKLEMPETTLLESLIEIANTGSVPTAHGLQTSDSVRLKAIEIILKLMGALSDNAVVVNVNTAEQKQRDAEREFAVYTRLKADKETTSRLLEIIESTAPNKG